MTTKPQIQPPEPRDAAERALVGDVIAEMQAQLAVIAKRRAVLPDGGFDPELATAAGSLGKVVLAAAAERRQQMKAAIREIAMIPIDQIVSFLKTLPGETRAEIARDLAGSDDEMGLL